MWPASFALVVKPIHHATERPRPRLPLVIHLLPYDGIGGVEVAARSVPTGQYDRFIFRKAFIATKQPEDPTPNFYRTNSRSENSPLAFIGIAYRVFIANPDVLIISLWRSCIVGLLVKLFRPRTRLVLFLHNNIDAHRVDAWLTRLTSRFSQLVWADSDATARTRLPNNNITVRTISFLTERFAPLPPSSCRPTFVWWGRLHRRKRLVDAVAFIDGLRHVVPDVLFTIIGPDGGEEAAVRRRVHELGLETIITFYGPADHSDLRRIAEGHCFYLQLSEAEGMSMSTVEAMQFGLVPIVTPVGEIAAYVVSGKSGLWVDDWNHAIHEVAGLTADHPRLKRMSNAAIEVWANRPLYREDFIAACCSALDTLPDPQ